MQACHPATGSGSSLIEDLTVDPVTGIITNRQQVGSANSADTTFIEFSTLDITGTEVTYFDADERFKMRSLHAYNEGVQTKSNSELHTRDDFDGRREYSTGESTDVTTTATPDATYEGGYRINTSGQSTITDHARTDVDRLTSHYEMFGDSVEISTHSAAELIEAPNATNGYPGYSVIYTGPIAQHAWYDVTTDSIGGELAATAAGLADPASYAIYATEDTTTTLSFGPNDTIATSVDTYSSDRSKIKDNTTANYRARMLGGSQNRTDITESISEQSNDSEFHFSSSEYTAYDAQNNPVRLLNTTNSYTVDFDSHFVSDTTTVDGHHLPARSTYIGVMNFGYLFGGSSVSGCGYLGFSCFGSGG